MDTTILKVFFKYFAPHDDLFKMGVIIFTILIHLTHRKQPQKHELVTQLVIDR